MATRPPSAFASFKPSAGHPSPTNLSYNMLLIRLTTHQLIRSISHQLNSFTYERRTAKPRSREIDGEKNRLTQALRQKQKKQTIAVRIDKQKQTHRGVHMHPTLREAYAFTHCLPEAMLLLGLRNDVGETCNVDSNMQPEQGSYKGVIMRSALREQTLSKRAESGQTMSDS